LQNASSGDIVQNFTLKNSNGIKMLKFSPFRENVLALAGIDGSVSVWDINSRMATAEFNSAHTSRVSAVAFSSFNHVLLCSASLDSKINFYDINEKKVVKSLNVDAPLTALAFYHDGRTLVVGTMYGNIYVYDLRAGATIKNSLRGHDKSNSINYLDFINIPDD
jgi:protein NEDD1